VSITIIDIFFHFVIVVSKLLRPCTISITAMCSSLGFNQNQNFFMFPIEFTWFLQFDWISIVDSKFGTSLDFFGIPILMSLCCGPSLLTLSKMLNTFMSFYL
jgi:hypothetical protein